MLIKDDAASLWVSLHREVYSLGTSRCEMFAINVYQMYS